MPDNPRKFELLSVALGSEFNECSIAAAELSKLVPEVLAAEGTEERVLYPLSETPTVGERFQVKPLPCHAKASEDLYVLALARRTTAPGPQRVFGKLIQKVGEVQSQTPYLVALMGDVYFPIASFARRSDGQCSYVQLGSEMESDDFFVTTEDESTSRLKIIDCIRNITDPNGVNEASDLDSLASRQYARFEKWADRAKEAQLARRASERIAKAQPVTLNFIGENVESPVSATTEGILLMRAIPLSDGRLSNLMLLNRGGLIHVVATARDNLALTLATIDTSSGTLNLDALGNDLPIEQRRKIVSTLHHLVRLPAPNVGITIYTNTVKDNRKRRAVAEVLAEQGLIDPRLDDDRKKDRPRHSDNIREAVKKFLMSPDTPFPLHNLSMGSVLEALRKNIPDGKSAYNRLRVEERLRATLGPTTPQEERLFGKLLVMTHKGTEFAAVVDKIRLGNTEGSARVIANVRREGFFIHVNISGAPLAMSDEAPKPIISYSFNATRPLFDRDNLTTEQATQKAKDLLEILELF